MLDEIQKYIQDDLCDIVYKLVGHYTTIQVFNYLDTNILSISYEKLKKLYKFKEIIFDNKIHYINSYKEYIKNNNNNNSNDISIFILSKQELNTTILFIKCNHYKIDGTLLFNILTKWSSIYTKIFQQNENKINKTQTPETKNVSHFATLKTSQKVFFSIDKWCKTYEPYLPIHPSFFQHIKLKYKFSDYVIITSIWSHYIYIRNKNSIFSHLFNYRPLKCKYKNGNYIYIDIIEISNNIINTCYILTNKVKKIKKLKLNKKIQGIKSVINILNLKNIFTTNILFDSWLMYKHLNFAQNKLNSVYTSQYNYNYNYKLFDKLNLPRLCFVTIHNGYYCLSNQIKNTYNSDFNDFMRVKLLDISP